MDDHALAARTIPDARGAQRTIHPEQGHDRLTFKDRTGRPPPAAACTRPCEPAGKTGAAYRRAGLMALWSLLNPTHSQ